MLQIHRLTFYTLITLILLVNFGVTFGQNTYNFDSTYIENFVNGNQTTIYEAVDSVMSEQLTNLERGQEMILKQLGELAIQKNVNKELEDSFARVALRTAEFQNKIEELKRARDSILNLFNKDSVIYEMLEIEYDKKLDLELASVWETSPDFDPHDNLQLVQFIEKQRVFKYGNILDIDCPHDHYYDLKKCNTCIRNHPGCWDGIVSGGMEYFFNGWGAHGKNINELKFSVPKYGSMNVFVFRAHYDEYSKLKRNKTATLDEQYEKYMSNKDLTIDDIVNPKSPCKPGYGILKVKNTTSNQVLIWLCDVESHTCSRNYNRYIIQISPFESGTFYSVKEGAYTYESQKGSGIIYPFRSGQVSISECQTEELLLK